jgi:hypothetical protein
MHGLHQDPKAYTAMLDDPARDSYQKPHEVIAALDLKPGSFGLWQRPGDLGACPAEFGCPQLRSSGCRVR